MKHTHEIRLENADILFKQSGLNNKEFAEKVGLKATYWGHIKKGKGIGNAISARIERAFNQAPGWLDNDHSKALTDSERRLITAYQGAPSEARAYALSILEREQGK